MNDSITLPKTLIKGLIAGLISAIVNAIIFYVFSSIGAITDDIMIQPQQPLAIQAVILSSIIPSLLAALVYFLIAKRSQYPMVLFQRIALILLILSFVNPFLFIPHVTVNYALALNAMHIVVAASIMYVLRKLTF